MVIYMTPEDYFSLILEKRGARAEMRLRHLMAFLYHHIDFTGKTVLDIGGGTGVHSFYALARGAAHSVVVEPEGDGGHSDMVSTFETLRKTFGNPSVDLICDTFQNYMPPSEGFDIVLVQDAINHFDEPACITLRQSDESRAVYAAIFSKIARVLRPGGYLVLSDCSSRNLFPLLGLRNPFDQAIEWHKHQPPTVWTELATAYGLQRLDLRWSSPARFGDLGQILFGNALASWFFTSHFVMTFRK